MIEALKSDELVQKAGGRFKLCVLMQRRLKEIMEGARPLVERGQLTDMEIVVEEFRQDKIALELETAEHQESLPAAADRDLLL